jgi:tetratricopeptide (TPR) repeat protein
MKTNSLGCKGRNFLAILALLSLFSCSKEKDTLPARVYHSTTSYFNGYYNANYLFNETIDRLEESYEFQDQGFIEIVYYGTKEEVKSLETDLETVSKKNDRVIFKHPNGSYIDDCRLLNGRSWLYRKNYTLALQNFDYVLETFPESPLLPEAWFRKAETYYLMGNGIQARSIIQEKIIENDSFYIEPVLAADMGIFQTRMAIEAKDYRKAIMHLQDALILIKGRRRIAHAHFLLGQLFQEINDFPRSLEQFNLVEKYSPNYDLAFRAKIKIARLYVQFQEGQDDDSEVFKYLTQLLKDEKNLEYQDQIYYEFALLELKKENQEAAIDYLRESIRANLSNQRQKALSYYKIGEIYFYEKQNYPQAQAYYDSAAQTISPNAPEYKAITSLAATLKDYITYKQTIHYQDSMLYLAALPKEELDALINEYVAEDKRRKEEEAELLLEQLNSGTGNDPFFNPAFQNMNRNQRRNQGGATWYFDNPSVISSGRLEFQQRWGTRLNEDDWRRSKRTRTIGGGPTAGEEVVAAPEVVDSTLLKQYGDKYNYYKDIPVDEAGITEANRLIEDAFYKLGQVYSQRLEEPDSAVKTFTTQLDRYPEGENYLRAHYALYQIHKERKNPVFRAHEAFILENAPNSIYAFLILGKDPNDMKKNEEEYAYVYDGVMNAYLNRMYESSVGFSEFLLARGDFEDDPNLDLAQLHYIRGMSYGYIGEQDSLEVILTRVVNQYPTHEVTPIAQKTLNFLRNGVPATNQNTSSETLPTAGGADPNDPRFKGFAQEPKSNDKIFVIMYIDKNRVSKSIANSKVADFNKAYAKNAKLKVFTFMYQQTHLLPYISHFPSVEEAEAYVAAFQQAPVAQEGTYPSRRQNRVHLSQQFQGRLRPEADGRLPAVLRFDSGEISRNPASQVRRCGWQQPPGMTREPPQIITTWGGCGVSSVRPEGSAGRSFPTSPPAFGCLSRHWLPIRPDTSPQPNPAEKHPVESGRAGRLPR